MDENFLPARRVWQRYNITPMTLWRWLRDAEMGFPPPPIYFGRFRYWKATDLEAWERSRPRGLTAAGARASQSAPEAAA